jgi:catechol 2,3-dioxygenase-like lactoylglutathione lyase family enzyme
MKLHHLAFRTRDLERCADFYRQVLGLKERQRQQRADGTVRAVWLAAGDTVLMLESAEAGEPVPSPGAMDLVAFAIEPGTHAEWRVRFAAAGVQVEGATDHTLYVRDPDGRRIGVSSYPFA